MILCIDGVVGAGKTTLAEKISQTLNIPLFLELGDPATDKLLSLFYEDKKRWAFTLQVHFLTKRYQMMVEAGKTKNVILDRSILGDSVFAKMLFQDGFMTKEEFDCYTILLNEFVNKIPKPDLLIYIDCTVDTAIERITQRGRDMEQAVDPVYWTRLNSLYTDWYTDYPFQKTNISATSYHPDNNEDILKIIENIKLIVG